MGLLYGVYGGRSDGFQPGWLDFVIDLTILTFFFILQAVLATRRDSALTVVSCRHSEVFINVMCLLQSRMMNLKRPLKPTWHRCEFLKAPQVSCLPPENSKQRVEIDFTFLAFMFESSMMFTITDYAMNRSGKLHGQFLMTFFFLMKKIKSIIIVFSPPPVHEPKMWDNLKGQFMNHIEEVNADLKVAGLPPLGSELKQQQ